MSNQNNVPTAPGWYYRAGYASPMHSQVLVEYEDGVLVYKMAGSPGVFDVKDDGLWLGPVPMPGEFVLIPKQPEPDGHTRSFAFQVDKDADGNYVATDLPPMEPIYDPEKWYSFTWNAKTGEMTPRDDDKPEEPR